MYQKTVLAGSPYNCFVLIIIMKYDLFQFKYIISFLPHATLYYFQFYPMTTSHVLKPVLPLFYTLTFYFSFRNLSANKAFLTINEREEKLCLWECFAIATNIHRHFYQKVFVFSNYVITMCKKNCFFPGHYDRKCLCYLHSNRLLLFCSVIQLLFFFYSTIPDVKRCYNIDQDCFISKVVAGLCSH